MTQCFRDNCLFYFIKENKLQGILMFHVDDFLSAGNEDFQKDIMLKLRKIYTFGKVSKGDFIFTGLHIYQNEEKEIFVDQINFIDSLPTFDFKKQDPGNILDRMENKLVRKTTGQLSWVSTQTRPDIAYDAFYLSTVLNRAKYKDAKLSKKTLLKAKEEKVKLKFSSLGNWKDLHIEVYADASLGGMEDSLQTKSVMGYFIALSNESNNLSPLHWKSKTIDKVAEDVKTAETLALETAIDDAVHLSSMITEIYSGEVHNTPIPLVIKEDSKSLIESLYSTKKVKRKTMRVVISSIQQNIKNGIIKSVTHVSSKQQLADIFTKKGVSSHSLLSVIEDGSLTPKTP